MHRLRILLFPALVALMALILWGVQKSRSPQVELSSYGKVGEFALTDQREQAYGSEQLRGTIWVANFVFTRCQGPCPLLSTSMASLHKKLAGLNSFRQITISIDPSFDSPAVLADYARKYDADGERWHFLTGDKERIIDIARSQFHLSADDNPDLHSTTFVLVDPSMEIRGYFDGKDPAALEQLTQAIEALGRKTS